jgi:hypothetical protein
MIDAAAPVAKKKWSLAGAGVVMPAPMPSPAPTAAAEPSVIIMEDWSSPKWRLNNLYTIVDATGNKIPFRMTEEQEQLFDNMWYWNSVLKARQMGFSTEIDLMALDQCLFVPNTRAGIIAQTEPDVMKLFKNKIRNPYMELPKALRDSIGLDRMSATEIVFGNGSSLQVGMSMRSDSLQFLHVSEFGKICAKSPERAREIVTGAFNAIAVGCPVFVESTAEGQEGYFHDYCMEALHAAQEGRKLSMRSFKLHFFAWWQKKANRLDADTVALTDNDNLYFDKLLAERQIILDAEQKAWYANEARTQKGDMHREHPSYPEEAFQASIEGAYYEKEMLWLRQNRRIASIPWDAALPVNTFWDFGVSTNNETTIWFHQRNGMQDLFIRYYEERGAGLKHFTDYMQTLGYTWGTHYLPHDANARMQTDKEQAESRLDILERLLPGHRFTVVPRVADVNNGIELTRERFPRVWMDKENCKLGIAALDAYVRTWNTRLNCFTAVPFHNWASNGADSFRAYGQGYHPSTALPSNAQKKPKTRNWRVV